MKISKLLLTSLLLTSLVFVSCDSSSTDPIIEPPVSGVEVLEGNLTTRTLTKDKKYLIKGQTFVRSGQTLTIQPGTIIKGDKATKGTLIIDRGGKMEAVGTAAEPIVFTSALAAGTRDRGDWGGLVILGNAPVNQTDPSIEGISPAVIFGGTDAVDNAGKCTLKYVRVEYAGIELTPNNETNSITMGGVGSASSLEYCQVSFGGDDGYEWFGGAISGKYLIAFAMWDDCFDVDFGYVGRNQFGLSVRYASFADQSGSNAFECDNGPNDNVTTLLTTGVFSNFTCIGPRATDSQSINANFQHAIDLRRRTAVTIANSLFMGYPRGLRMNQQSVFDNYAAGTGKLLNNILVIPAASSSIIPFSNGSGMTATAAQIEAWFNDPANSNTRISAPTADQFAVLGLANNLAFGANVPSAYPSNPNFGVASGTLASGASFAGLTGLQTVTYRGAFGTSDWTDGWASFVPNANTY